MHMKYMVYTPNLEIIFVSDLYLAIIGEIKAVFGCVLLYLYATLAQCH